MRAKLCELTTSTTEPHLPLSISSFILRVHMLLPPTTYAYYILCTTAMGQWAEILAAACPAEGIVQDSLSQTLELILT